MWTQRDPDSISFEDAEEILKDTTQRALFPSQYNTLLASIQARLSEVASKSKEINPIAWIQPSYEQTLKLNCWALGIDYIIDFDANRIGKTTAGVINTLLWLIPSQPDWIMHTPHTDSLNRTFHTLPRPPIHIVSFIAKQIREHQLTPDPKLPLNDPINLPTYNLTKLILANPPPPPPTTRNSPRTIWVGAPDNDYHAEIVMPEFKKWIPHHILEDYSTYAHTIKLHPRTTLLFKSYDSKDTKWSGAAVDGIMLTEGVPQDVFNEVRQRFKYPAFGSWDYTPYESRNTASRSALAYKVFKGQEKLPLNPTVFHGFGLHTAPDYILPADKKADLIKVWAGKPQGEARIKGLFYASSPVILKNYDPQIHALPISFAELTALYAPRPLILFRGLDPGWGHVTACAWLALAPDNTRYIYKFYAESQKSIEERCQDIITLSGNTRIPHPKSPGVWKEEITSPATRIQISWIDYHSFKTDENTKRPFALNYINHGLVVRPSITFGPKERAIMFNDMLLPQIHLPHPTTKKPPGSKIYFLINEPGVAAAVNKITELFWQTFEQGDKRGLPKDAPQDFDDDELDATCYVACPTLSYQSFFSFIATKNTSQTSKTGISYSNVTFLK